MRVHARTRPHWRHFVGNKSQRSKSYDSRTLIGLITTEKAVLIRYAPCEFVYMYMTSAQDVRADASSARSNGPRSIRRASFSLQSHGQMQCHPRRRRRLIDNNEFDSVSCVCVCTWSYLPTTSTPVYSYYISIIRSREDQSARALPGLSII